MNPKRTILLRKGFTLVELLVVVAIVVIMFALMTPSPNRRARETAKQVQCLSNLRRVGIGLLLYSEDNNNLFPWQASPTIGGTPETVVSGRAVNQFSKITAYLRTPAVFICPTDKARVMATTNFVGFSDTNISYFVSISATAMAKGNQSSLILGGDRHLSASNQPVKPGLYVVDTNSTLGWTQELHESREKGQRGNLLFSDGSVVFVPSSDLPASFRNQSITASRLVIP